LVYSDKEILDSFEEYKDELLSFFNRISKEYGFNKKQTEILFDSVKHLVYFLKMDKTERIEAEIQFNEENRSMIKDKLTRLKKFYSANKDLVDEGLSLPEVFAIHQNYPNPFNPVTTLRYELPENNLVNITIYDILGREVRTMVNTTQDAGYKSVIWNATNDYGKPVSAGVYLYQIQAGDFIQTKKMVLLK